MFKKNILCLLLSICLFYPSFVEGIKGKVDFGVVFMDVDIIDTVHAGKSLSVGGISGNATILLIDGLCLKPRMFVGSGAHSDIYNLSFGVGYFLPVSECFNVTPNMGVSYGKLKANVDLTAIGPVSEKYDSWTPYIGLDFGYTINEQWALSSFVQYGWSRTRSEIRPHVGPAFIQTTESTGPNYGFQVDYYFNCNWSVNLTFAKNTSSGRENHGIKGSGVRMGLGYFF